ncbi:MAG: glycerol-3-phosphate 1-O-acyltransferase PlsY [Firmicutes bacterium]|nr:glycerol-3-phosphate 1-O-acyltransferase PlsY [Bacillota bacterium]
MYRIICLAVGYFVGCIQSAYFVGRFMHVDIREHGSGNLGTTNAMRVLGKKAGAITFICDILKSIVPFIICCNVLDGNAMAGVYASFGAVLGHDFPFYLKFRGGKGIAATVGMVLAMAVSVNPLIAAITYAVGIVAIVATNTISAGSMVFSIAIPIACIVVGEPWEMTAVTAVMCVLALYKHRSNAGRLMSGTENKFIKKKN